MLLLTVFLLIAVVIFKLVQALIAHTGAFGVMQWLYVAGIAALAAAEVFLAIKLWKMNKEGAENQKRMLEEQKEADARRRREFYLDDFAGASDGDTPEAGDDETASGDADGGEESPSQDEQPAGSGSDVREDGEKRD